MTKISESFKTTTFLKILLLGTQKFIHEHFDALIEDSNIDYENYGTAKEVKLKKIIQIYGKFNIVFEEIDIAFIFLQKKRNLINEHYPGLEYQEDYYKYHLENVYNRLVTLLDIVGKLGVLIYGFNLKKINAYTFKERARKEGYKNVSEITQFLIDKIKKYKVERNSKLHTGESKNEELSKVIFWDVANKLIHSDPLIILEDKTDEEITEVLEILKSEIIEIIAIIENFIDESTEKLKEIIESQ